MKKKILKGAIVIGLLVSVFANFHEPILWVDSGANQVDLALNVHNKTFQPIYISKSSGITETINAKMKYDATTTPGFVEIKTIELNTIKISGLLNHRVDTASVGADSNGVPIIYIKMKLRLKRGKEPYPISVAAAPKHVRDAFCFNSKKRKQVLTVVDFGLSDEIRKEIRKIMAGSKPCFTKNRGKKGYNMCFTDIQDGSICNFDIIHEE